MTLDKLPLGYVVRADVQRLLYQLLNSNEAISAKASYIATKVGNRMTQATLQFEEKRLDLVAKYADRDESGSIVWNDDKGPDGKLVNRQAAMSAEQRVLFDAEAKALLAQEVEVYRMNPEILSEFKISPADMQVLQPLVLT